MKLILNKIMKLVLLVLLIITICINSFEIKKNHLLKKNSNYNIKDINNNNFIALFNKKLQLINKDCNEFSYCSDESLNLFNIKLFRYHFSEIMSPLYQSNVDNKQLNHDSSIFIFENVLNLYNKKEYNKILEESINYVALFCDEYIICTYACNQITKLVQNNLTSYYKKKYSKGLFPTNQFTNDKEKIKFFLKYLELTNMYLYERSKCYKDFDKNLYYYYYQKLFKITIFNNKFKEVNFHNKVLALNTPLLLSEYDVNESDTVEVPDTDNFYLLIIIKEISLCKLYRIKAFTLVKPFTMYKIVESELIDNTLKITLKCVKDDIKTFNKNDEDNNLIKGFQHIINHILE